MLFIVTLGGAGFSGTHRSLFSKVHLFLEVAGEFAENGIPVLCFATLIDLHQQLGNGYYIL